MNVKPKNIKREQKISLFFNEISRLIQQLTLDEPELSKIFVTRVRLSKDYKICFVYFSTYTDKQEFYKALETLKLYKPSLKKSLAGRVGGKYAADLVFLYDINKDKERKINRLLDEVVKDIPEE